jgi:hypothetical protein
MQLTLLGSKILPIFAYRVLFQANKNKDNESWRLISMERSRQLAQRTNTLYNGKSDTPTQHSKFEMMLLPSKGLA